MADTALNIEIDDDDDLDDFYDDDEDSDFSPAYANVIAQLPEGWYLVKVFGGWAKMSEAREWLIENCVGAYREVNWATGSCSSACGVMLEEDMDIILFKLRWS